MASHESAQAGPHRRLGTAPQIAMVAVAVVAVIALIFGAVSYFRDDDNSNVLTAGDNGTTVKMKPAQELQVNLESNATTGYEWAIDALDETVVQSLGSTYVSPDNPKVGEGGHEEWRFRSLNPGTATLKLKYWRGWEGDNSVADRFEITIVVSD